MSEKEMVQNVIHSTNHKTPTHAAQGIARSHDSFVFSHVCNTIMVVCAVRNYALDRIIVAPKPQVDARAHSDDFASTKWKAKLLKDSNSLTPKCEKICITTHCPSLHAASPIRLTSSSRKKHYACSESKKQPWRSHSKAICGDWVAKHNRTTRNWVGNCSSKTTSRR